MQTCWRFSMTTQSCPLGLSIYQETISQFNLKQFFTNANLYNVKKKHVII